MKIIETSLQHPYDFDRRKSTTMVVLHHAEASQASVEDINRWHLARNFNGIGYHYYIRKDGSIYRGRPEWSIGAHAIGANDWSIGVCCEGAYMTETMPAVQLSALKALLRDIMARNGRLSLVRHKDVSETDCPGSKFPWAEAQKYEEDDEMNEKQVREIFDEMFNARLPRHKSVDEFSGTVKAELQDLIADGSLKGKAGSDAAKGLDLTDDMARALVIAKRYTDGVFDAE